MYGHMGKYCSYVFQKLFSRDIYCDLNLQIKSGEYLKTNRNCWQLGEDCFLMRVNPGTVSGNAWKTIRNSVTPKSSRPVHTGVPVTRFTPRQLIPYQYGTKIFQMETGGRNSKRSWHTYQNLTIAHPIGIHMQFRCHSKRITFPG